MKHLLLFVALALLFGGLIAGYAGAPLARWAATSIQSASVFLVESITSQKIRSDYASEQVKILLVPGHQPNVGGAEYGSASERDIVVDIADAFAADLAQDPHIEVTVARDKTGWDETLDSYIQTHVNEIEAFRAAQEREMATHVANKSILLATDPIYHLDAPAASAIQLYGINKWASENGYDITIHLHINDYARHGGQKRYRGYAVYVPDHQYSNAAASRELGEAIVRRLALNHAPSTMPGEGGGVVEDQQLIAIGSNNTADDAALLVEYGYIYEPQFATSALRAQSEKEYAHATFLGILDFLQARGLAP